MKIKQKTLMINIEHNIILAKGMVSVTVEHQAVVYQDEKDLSIGVDIELMDWYDVTFMDMPVNGMKEFEKHLSGLGIDFHRLLNDSCVGLFSNDDIEKLKSMFTV
jgi:hypothetical protein